MNSKDDAQQKGAQAGKTRWRRWLVEGLLVVAVLVLVQWWQARDAATGPAPALAGITLQGEVVDLTKERGKPLLVHFWAEWCPICSLEEGSIESLSHDYRVISVATTSGDAAEVRAHMQKQGLSFPVLLDEDGAIARHWGLKGVPASFVIDSEGQIVNALIGYTSGIGFRVRMWLAGL